ncbi:hypothetical protein V6N13_106171 [Hibiscus sabdariffa]|uniref:Uncharacterized protein n=1 Tax=Hibiscus sabdariffa TaxID=183260 RepID=A0ABR2EZV7_9ROSI
MLVMKRLRWLMELNFMHFMNEVVSESVVMWKQLANCLVAINGVIKSVMPTIHGNVAMCDILRKLRADAIDVDSILKCTFFWEWNKKKEFISRINELKTTSHMLDESCEKCFHDWVSRAKNDPDLKVRLSYYESLPGILPSIDSQRPPKECLSFIRGSFEHFHVTRKKAASNINSTEDLQRIYDFVFQDYCSSFIGVARSVSQEFDFEDFL